MGFYSQAVKYDSIISTTHSLFHAYNIVQLVFPTRTYVKASRVLEQYQHMPSFSGIQSDCQSIVARLKAVLKKRLDDPNVSWNWREKHSMSTLLPQNNVFFLLFFLFFLFSTVYYGHDGRDSGSTAGAERASVSTLSPVS